MLSVSGSDACQKILYLADFAVPMQYARDRCHSRRAKIWQRMIHPVAHRIENSRYGQRCSRPRANASNSGIGNMTRNSKVARSA